MPQTASTKHIRENIRRADVALEMSERIKPMLAGHPPEIQSAALADLVSIWLAGHPPVVRDEVFALFIGTVRHLLPFTEMEMFPNGLPKEWIDGE